MLSSESKESAVPLRGGEGCSEECWTSASVHPPRSQSRIGLEEVFQWVMVWLQH